MNKDYYKILGIQKGATGEEVKKAYYKLAHQYHPDKGGDEKKFKEINEAYQTLSNNEKRAQYDRFGRTFEGAGQDQGFSGFRWSWGTPGSGTENDEASEGFGFDFSDVGDIFEDFFGAGAGQHQERDSRRGNDIEVDLEIPLEAVLKTQEQMIRLRKFVVCTRCQGAGAEPNSKVKECFSCRGTGQVQKIQRTIFGTFTRAALCPECKGEGWRPEKPCIVCKGEGRIRGDEELKVFIPAGVDTNQVLKFEQKGDAGRKKGKNGDLYLRIRLKPHSIFERKGDDLYMALPISFSQAALGDQIEIPVIEGTKTPLNILAGTESGKIFRVPEKGVPRFSRLGRGNLYVTLEIKTPKKLTREQKELLEKLKKEGI